MLGPPKDLSSNVMVDSTAFEVDGIAVVTTTVFLLYLLLLP
jgi:hypothetical protein